MTVDNIIVGEPVYIVGHRKPDVDAIVSAYAYQVYRHARGDFNYIAIRCDEVNPLTEWLFEETEHQLPPLVEDVSGRKLVLVDHTDPDQRAAGWENAEVIEVVDHHKLKLETSAPAKITVRPYGSTTTLIAEKLLRNSFYVSPKFAQLMLSAILDDTLALRSPITTYTDKTLAGKLAAMSGLEDMDAYAKKMFNKKDSWHTMKADKIVETDIKDFDFGSFKAQVSQVETLDSAKLSSKLDDIQEYLNKKSSEGKYELMIVMITDIIKSEAQILAAGKRANDLEKIFNKNFENGIMVIPGMVSRKKDLIPHMVNFYK